MSNITLKLLLNTILIISSVFKSYTQENLNFINKVKYTILDSDSKSFRPFFGTDSRDITFKLIELKNLKTDSIIYGVEVNINTNEIIQSGKSIAFTNVSSLWGVSTNTTYDNIEKSGYIFLDKNDMSDILNFLNEIIKFSNQPQEKFTLYKISIREKFQIGMVYDPENNNSNKWEFVFKANDAVYRMKYDKGFSLLLSLSKFNKFLNEN
ncbi:hypothetical protein [Wenyingzhuangia sp. 2_MG-2023]|uniref:hypothetical protein n=1 Tax=Wenyingzhuangia sp. 2_MG-2023 TaxID=3062639 RepID=UPI0026E4162C|nr:hypothetical protein [Wenyingzhuangia sp. 2_MG-2023]MDO6739348.1 hypothetical protein [Wenyingzhuangia sp. 2_MG-2023]